VDKTVVIVLSSTPNPSENKIAPNSRICITPQRIYEKTSRNADISISKAQVLVTALKRNHHIQKLRISGFKDSCNDSDIRVLTSDIRPRESDIRHQTSDSRLQTQTPNFRNQTSQFRHQSIYFRHQTIDLRL
jgi:hypothetical protein